MSEDIWYPKGKEQEVCAICESPLERRRGMSHVYPNVVCWICDMDALNKEGEEAQMGSEPQSGDNPVFIDGQKCWRRYKFGGFISRVDQFDCEDIWEFREKHES